MLKNNHSISNLFGEIIFFFKFLFLLYLNKLVTSELNVLEVISEKYLELFTSS